MTNYIEGFDPAGAALTELKKQLDKELEKFEIAKSEVAADIEKINYRCADLGTGAARYLNPEKLTIISAKVQAYAQAIDILQYYIDSFAE